MECAPAGWPTELLLPPTILSRLEWPIAPEAVLGIIPHRSLASIGGLPLLFARPVFKAVPTARSIAKAAVAERAPGTADNAKVEMRHAFTLIPAATVRAGLVVRRLLLARGHVTLEPGRWRYQPRLEQGRLTAILTNLERIARGCPIVRCTFLVLSNFSRFSSRRGRSTNSNRIADRAGTACWRFFIRFW
jgi:hypothetical protein